MLSQSVTSPVTEAPEGTADVIPEPVLVQVELHIRVTAEGHPTDSVHARVDVNLEKETTVTGNRSLNCRSRHKIQNSPRNLEHTDSYHL